MASIIKLPEKIQNLIAAGEVIDKLSSIVKELVENSIDAHATEIEVYLKDSGIEKISVRDNGIGMDLEDANLAFSRHATSKIKDEYDLFRIHTLGFRGEAIPSIASISKFELETNGNRIVYLNGKKIEESISSTTGTYIQISNIFYNTPARLKYLKSPYTELANIIEVMTKFAFANPFIKFTLKNNDKTILSTSGKGDLVEVINSIFDYNTAKKAINISGESRNYKIHGIIISPTITRSNRFYMTVLVNSRVIYNNKILNAIRDAYGTYLFKGRYPICVLYIDVDPLLIDVNVHPTKHEIKFSIEDELIELIISSIKEGLKDEKPIVNVSIPLYDKKEDSYNDKVKDYKETLTNLFNVEEEKEEYGIERKIPKLEYIGQFAGTYLLCQNEEGLFIIDQHAAAERIRYERYLEKMSNPKKEYYDLLIPLEFNLSLSENYILNDYLEDIKNFGITLEIDEDKIKILSIPAYFPKGLELIYTEEVVRIVLKERNSSILKDVDQMAKNLSCKHSIKANHYISRDEIEKLLSDLEMCNNPYTCPHGRPTIIKYSKLDLEKMFKRVE